MSETVKKRALCAFVLTCIAAATGQELSAAGDSLFIVVSW
jgi:hypothetical protein